MQPGGYPNLSGLTVIGTTTKRGRGRKGVQPFIQTVDLEPYLPQQEDVNALGARVEKNIRVLRETSETGLGKSIVAMQLARQLKLVMFVISPAAVTVAWEEKFRRFKGFNNFIVYPKVGKDKRVPRIPAGTHVIISYEMVKAIAKDSKMKVVGGQTISYYKHSENPFFNMTGIGKGATYGITTRILELGDLPGCNGILFVVDESQSTKNEHTINSRMITTLCKRINMYKTRPIESDGKRYYRYQPPGQAEQALSIGIYTSVLLMSATPLDKAIHIYGQLQMLGITDTPQPYIRMGGNWDLTELKKVIQYCANLGNPQLLDRTAAILYESNSPIMYGQEVNPKDPNTWRGDAPVLPEISAKNILELVDKLWSRVIVEAVSVEMPLFVERNAYKGYFPIDHISTIQQTHLSVEQRYPNLLMYVQAVFYMFGYKIERFADTPVPDGLNDSGIERSQKGIDKLDEACMDGICRAAMYKLTTDRTCKVIIGVNRIEVGYQIAERLSREAYQNGLVGYGNTDFVGRMWKGQHLGKKAKLAEEQFRMNEAAILRNHIISDAEYQRARTLFQADNDLCRVVVMTMNAGKGIDLNDVSQTPGGKQRYTFCNTCHSPTDLHQINGRSHRANSTTLAKSFIYYPDIAGTSCELILSKLRVKDNKISESTAGFESIKSGERSKRLFPAHYPRCVIQHDFGENYVDEELINWCVEQYKAGALQLDNPDHALAIHYAKLSNDDYFVIELHNPDKNGKGIPLRDGPPRQRQKCIDPSTGQPFRYGACIVDPNTGEMRNEIDTTRIPSSYTSVERGAPYLIDIHFRQESYALASKIMNDVNKFLREIKEEEERRSAAGYYMA